MRVGLPASITRALGAGQSRIEAVLPITFEYPVFYQHRVRLGVPSSSTP